MPKILLAVLGFGLVGPLLGMNTSPDSKTPTLNVQKALVVKVRAQGGAALQGVRVCAGTATNACVDEAQTSRTGLAVLQNVPYGNIRVTATKDGYALAEQDMNFNARSTPLDMFLQPEPKRGLQVPLPGAIPVILGVSINGGAKTTSSQYVRVGFNSDTPFTRYCVGNVTWWLGTGAAHDCRGVAQRTQHEARYQLRTNGGKTFVRRGYAYQACVRVQTWSGTWSEPICKNIRYE